MVTAAARPAGARCALGWVSLDATDNDPARFWGYVVAALRAVRPEIGAGAHAALRTPGAAPETIAGHRLGSTIRRNDCADVAPSDAAASSISGSSSISTGCTERTTNGSVTLSDAASPKFADWAGVSNNYGEIKFTVAPNTDRLQASIAYFVLDGALRERLRTAGRERALLFTPGRTAAAHLQAFAAARGRFSFGEYLRRRLLDEPWHRLRHYARHGLRPPVDDGPRRVVS